MSGTFGPLPERRELAASAARTVAATVLLAPVLALAALALAVQSVASGWIFRAVLRLAALLPEDPVWGTLVLSALGPGSIALLLLACIRFPRLFPVLLLAVGGVAEVCVFALAPLDAGAMWVPGLGAAGLLLAAWQVRAGRPSGPSRTPEPRARRWPAANPNGLTARLLGVACLLLAAGVAWYGGLRPLQLARAGAPGVDYGMKAFLVAPLAALGGLALLGGGAPVLRAFSRPPQGRTEVLGTIVLVGLSFVIGGLAFWWVGEQLRALGYNVA